MGIKAIQLNAFTERTPIYVKLYHSQVYRITGYADWRKGRFCHGKISRTPPEPA